MHFLNLRKLARRLGFLFHPYLSSLRADGGGATVRAPRGTAPQSTRGRPLTLHARPSSHPCGYARVERRAAQARSFCDRVLNRAQGGALPPVASL